MRAYVGWLMAFCLGSFAYALPIDNNTTQDTNKSQITKSNITQTDNKALAIKKAKDAKLKAQIKKLLDEKNRLDKEISENNIWTKIYSNYHIYKELKNQSSKLYQDIITLQSKFDLSDDEKVKLKKLQEQQTIIQGKLQLLKEYEKDPFKKFITPPKIDDVPTVSNPLAVISAISYQEKLKSDQKEYQEKFTSIEQLIQEIKQKKAILLKLTQLDPKNQKFKQELKQLQDKLDTFMPELEIFKTTQNVYIKKIDEITLNLKQSIKREIQKAFNIGTIILAFILFTLIIKYLVKRYMSDNERFYTINKALNITFFTLLIFTLLFAYIENVSYLVTILGFASAGIAIAMKDWFMSIMGWFVIVIGGAVHVGDRVKFVRNGMEYLGDVIDISMLRMTIQEDISLTTYMHNRRAGRIIFVPNNFIFTDMVANYTHAGLKTVWDGIDFTITFDSNAQKAAQIAKEVTKKYSKGYTEITRKQLNKLRSQYSVKNTNVEPRIYTFIEPNGVRVSAWYHTNAYATLTLRSTISMEILEKIQAEDSITMAYPTQSIYINKDVRKPKLPPTDDEGVV
jgi:small-conductance mechanosensitive channel